jgi:hypothetical protein
MPYKLEKSAAHKGYPYAIVFDSGGWRCGYVGITKSHPLYDQTYNEFDIHLSVHGGVTYSEFTTDTGYPLPFDDIKWIGFDCAHAGDGIDLYLSKAYRLISDADYFTLSNVFHNSYDIIRSEKYVEDQCISLIEQLEEIVSPKPVEKALNRFERMKKWINS